MLSRIQITNLGPFAEFNSGALPAVALISGDNGIGKTGLLECVKWVGASGHDPDMIHGGAEAGEVVITTDTGAQLRARTSRKETTRGWKPKDGKRWIPGREEIDKIYKSIAYDPLAFLALKPKEQADALAALSPVSIEPAELKAAIGGAAAEALAAVEYPISLDVIAAVRQSIYDARRGLNTGADTQEAHAGQLEKTLPAAAPEGKNWMEEANRLISAREAGMAERADLHRKIAANADKRERAINHEIDLRIAELEAERTARLVESAKASNVEYGEIDGSDLNRITSELATAQERARTEQQAEGTRAAIAAARKDAEAKRARSEVLTAALSRLDALKKKVAAGAPIPGVIFQGGRIVREQDGAMVPLSHWNTADQYRFCLRLGLLMGGGFVCVDHLEAFTDANQARLFEAARAYAAEDGVQFLFAKVDPAGGPLRITPVETVAENRG